MNDPLTLKIVELIPEIMELKFGCKIRIHSNTAMGDAVFHKFGERLYWLGGDASKWYCSKGWIDYQMFLELQRKGSVEILGRPITLADVLRAIAIEAPMHVSFNLPFTNFGNAEFLYRMGDGEIIAEEWNLALNLDEQTDETKTFISKLLGV